MKDIQLEEVMIKNVATVRDDEKVTTAAKDMSKRNIGSIIVADKEDPIGILTEKDLLHKVVAKGLDPNTLLVRDIMTSSLITCEPETSVFDAHKIMNEHKFRRLPIVKNNKLLGIVTETDLSSAMRNFGTAIKPSFETPTTEKVKSLRKYNLSNGNSYVFVEEKQDKVYDAFISKISEGYAGLGIVRVNPETIKKQYGLKKTMLIWLTEINGENCIRPTELEKLLFTINSFIGKAEKSVVMFDGIEYLENYTSFKEVFHLIQNLVDKVSMTNSILLSSMDKDTFDKKEFHLLERGFKVYEDDR